MNEEPEFLLPRSKIGVCGPWLVSAFVEPRISLDSRQLDSIAVITLTDAGKTAAGLELMAGDFVTQIYVSDGHEAAATIVARLHPYTRHSVISRPEVYVDAKDRLHQLKNQRGRWSAPTNPMLLVGSAAVRADERYLHIGDTDRYTAEEIKRFANDAVNLTTAGGGVVQAALVLLATSRTKRREDIRLLSKRLTEYERHTIP